MDQYGYLRVAGAVPTVEVADCTVNADRIECLMRRAAEKGAEVILFPELSLTGATCGDLLLQPTLQRGAIEALQRLVERSADCPIAALVGLPVAHQGKLYNCAALLCQGEIVGIVPKIHLNKGEERWFHSGVELHDGELVCVGDQLADLGVDLLFEINGVKVGVEIGEDLWAPTPLSTDLAAAGAQVILNPAAHSEQVGQDRYISDSVRLRSAQLEGGYLYVSAGFGESTTDYLFGGRVLMAECGEVVAQSERFQIEEQLILTEIDTERIAAERIRTRRLPHPINDYTHCPCRFQPKNGTFQRTIDPHPFIPCDPSERESRCEEIFQIQALALAKRLRHTGCKRVVIGISGGLDSTLALLVAVKTFDRLGLDRRGIYGITMPGFGTSDRTYHNALDLMQELGISQEEISIVKAVKQHFADIGLEASDRSATYENSQARERTQILMDFANKVGGLVVGTGDLSELALGWATYNGDHMSMYGVNASIPKTLVRHLVSHVAEQMGGKVGATLRDIVDTPVSPELLPADQEGKIAQKTEDLVGPYELHDFMLYHLLRRGATPRKLLFMAEEAFRGAYSRNEILKWMRILFRRFFSQQFKRSALPDGPKVGSVGLSPRGDWQMPSDASAALWMTEVEKLEQENN